MQLPADQETRIKSCSMERDIQNNFKPNYTAEKSIFNVSNMETNLLLSITTSLLKHCAFKDPLSNQEE